MTEQISARYSPGEGMGKSSPLGGMCRHAADVGMFGTFWRNNMSTKVKHRRFNMIVESGSEAR